MLWEKFLKREYHYESLLRLGVNCDKVILKATEKSLRRKKFVGANYKQLFRFYKKDYYKQIQLNYWLFKIVLKIKISIDFKLEKLSRYFFNKII